MKPNKDYYELRLSADELRMIDESLKRGPIDKDSEDDYNRLRSQPFTCGKIHEVKVF